MATDDDQPNDDSPDEETTGVPDETPEAEADVEPEPEPDSDEKVEPDSDEKVDPRAGEAPPERRTFLKAASSVAMGASLLASYGTFGSYLGRFLYPAGAAPTGWFFVHRLDTFPVGSAYTYRTPAKEEVVVVRRGDAGTAEDFLAFSSTCPHLGCKVHWEPQNDRFFCPCHNGIFNADGFGTGGPPEGQWLPRFPLKVEGGLLYMKVRMGGGDLRPEEA